MRRAVSCAMRLAGLALLFGLAGCTAIPPADAPSYKVVSVQPGDSVTFNTEAGNVTIDVTSARGIGSVEIERLGAAPKTLTVNFHLKGLEEASLGWGAGRVTVHVASRDGSVSEEAQQPGSQPQSIDSASPYWMPVRIEPQGAAIPLQNGFFSVAAPTAFLEAAPARFSLTWVDFYR